LLISVVGLFTLIALLLTEENWRGKRAWENFRSEWEAKGERFDLASFIPQTVQGDLNFVMTPFFAPLLQGHATWRKGERKSPLCPHARSTFTLLQDLPLPLEA